MESMFMWFMVAVVGLLLAIRAELHGIAKSLKGEGRERK